MIECLSCKSPIAPGRIICKDCARKILNGKTHLLLGRQNCKDFIRRMIIADLQFYNEMDEDPIMSFKSMEDIEYDITGTNVLAASIVSAIKGGKPND